MQKRFHSAVRNRDMGRFLMILEHPPTYTGGRKTLEESVQGVDVIKVDRGGDVTYHGPGQLVIYPIFPVGPEKPDVRRFVKEIEETIISALRDLGFVPFVGDEPGIWISGPLEQKVCSIGMAIDHGVSYHGVSINYARESVEGFQAIRPCGMDPSVIGFIDREREALKRSILKSFSDQFGHFTMIPASQSMSMISCSVQA